MMADRKHDIIDMPPSDHWTPEQAIAAAAKTGWDSVLVVGFDDKGELQILSSRMTLGETLYVLKEAEYSTMGVR